MKNKSIWLDYKNKNITESLKHDIITDVLIIGGGLSGISVAYHLIESGLKVTLVERNEVGSGITSRTTGKLTYLQENLYSKLKCYHGIKKANSYYKSQVDAINIVKDIINKENIDCNLEKVRSYIFDTNPSKVKKEVNVLKRFNIDLKEEKINNSLFYYVDDTYVFHPLKYLFKLKDICIDKGINIYEHTKIEEIKKDNDNYICYTKDNNIKCKYIVIASHYPYFLFPFPIPFKSYIEKSYIKAFKTKDNKKLSAINLSKPTISMRYISDNNTNYEIYLTNSHNLAIKNDERYNFKELLSKHDITPDYIWSNTDIMTYDALPFIGRIKDNIFLATGYNTWGMTNASLAGKIISDIILKRDNPYIELFNPKRSFNIGKIINFPNIIISNIYSFTKSKIKKNKSWYSPQVYFKNINGKSIGIYKDENNIEHKVYNACPHIKCSLIFNEEEKTWECPCHSSRFDIDGNVIDGPSNYNITYKD